MIKKYIIVEDDGDGDIFHYSIEMKRNNIDDGTIKLSYGDDGWVKSIKGELAASLSDNGNGISIKLVDNKKKIKLDYCQVIELLILLKQYNTKDFKYSETTFQKFVEIED